MLLCVCLNPALDVTYRLDGVAVPGESHRVREVRERAGGKGVNVARVLQQLGTPATVLGFAGGPNGAALREELDEDGVPAVLVDVAGPTRRTLTVVDGRQATAFSEPGPSVSATEWAALQGRFLDLLPEADGVVLSGSLPPGAPQDAYAQLIRTAGRPVLLDADGEALRKGLWAGPALVKPNLAELRGILGEDGPPIRTPQGRDWLLAAGQRLLDEGARSAVVSLGSEGLFATGLQGTWRAVAADTLTGNPTGAGDALAAVLARGLVTGRPAPDLLRDAVATAAAAVACPVAGEVDLEVRARLSPTVVVQDVSRVEEVGARAPGEHR